MSITYKFVPDADAAANALGSRRVDGYTVENDYDRLSQMYGGLWADMGTEQIIH